MTRPRRWLTRLRLTLELGCVALAVALAVLWAQVPDPSWLIDHNPSTTAFIELRRREAAAEQRTLRLRWRWRPLAQISPYLRAAVVYTEDDRFYEHDGVDWTAIEHAVRKNQQRGSLSVGGSTITQQLAKNLYLSPSRSLLRKVRELLITGRLEDSLDKQRILELYLNVAEWGDGVFGAEAAAQRWFHCAARQLSAAQAARLAVALPNPFTRSPKERTTALQRKVARVLLRLRQDRLLSRAQFERAAEEAGLPVPNAAVAEPVNPEDLPGEDADEPGPIRSPAQLDLDAGDAAPGDASDEPGAPDAARESAGPVATEPGAEIDLDRSPATAPAQAPHVAPPRRVSPDSP